MSNRSIRKTVTAAWKAARSEVVAPWLRKHRSTLFQVYALIALLVFAVLAALAATNPYLGFDLEFTRELQEETPAWFGSLLRAISWPGYGAPAVGIIALVVIFLGFFGLRWEAASALFAAVSTGALNYLIKIAIRRPRPSADLVDVVQELNTYSFPSGHTMFYTAFFGFLLFLAFILLRHSWRRALAMLVLGGLVALVGFSRMYLGEHWASDVIAGYLLGSLMLVVAIRFYHWGKQRFVIDQPVAPSEAEDDLVQFRRSPIPVTSHETEDHEHHPDRTEERERPPGRD
jgi:undecaprenyl-diphosphatase